MIVKRVEPGGTLRVTPLGKMYPGNFGLGQVAVLGDQQTLMGVLSVGSEHTTKESRQIWEPSPTRATKPWTGCTSTSSPAAPPRS
jgi:putative aminopeptidase FrvX